MGTCGIRRPVVGLVVAALVSVLLVGTPASANQQALTRCPDATETGVGFVDVPAFSEHARAIACLVAFEITSGVTADTFVPGGTVTRAQMATFIRNTLRSQGYALPSVSSVPFGDVTGVHAEAIAQLAAAGIVRGTTPDTYAPSAPVRRDQMATFLVNAAQFALQRELPVDGAVGFPDVAAGGTHAQSILKVAAAGIAAGTAGGEYRPSAEVSRAQMATFLARLLNYLHDQDGGSPSDPDPSVPSPDPGPAPPDEVPAPPPVTPIVPDTTRVLSGEQRDALVEATEDALRFAALPDGEVAFEPGEVIVSEPAPAAPDGLLRRVLDVEVHGEQVVVATEHADLTDAIHQADISMEVRLSPEDVVAEEVDGVVTLTGVDPLVPRNLAVTPSTRSFELFAFREEFEEQFTAEAGAAEGQVTVSGQTAFDLVLDLDARIRPRLAVPPAELERFRIALELEEESQLTIDSSVTASWSGARDLKTLHLRPMVFFVPAAPVPVPVVLTPRIDLTLTGEGSLDAQVVLSASSTTSAEGGVEYRRGEGWSPVVSYSNQFVLAEPSAEVSGKLEAGVDVQGAVLVYGLAGVHATGRPYARLDARVRAECIRIDGFVGVVLSIGLTGAEAIFSRLPELDLTILEHEEHLLNRQLGQCVGQWTGTIRTSSAWSSEGLLDRDSAEMELNYQLAGRVGLGEQYRAWITGSGSSLKVAECFTERGTWTADIPPEGNISMTWPALRLDGEPGDDVVFIPHLVIVQGSFRQTSLCDDNPPTQGEYSISVGGFQSGESGFEYRPDPLPDTDPDPLRLVGSRTWTLDDPPYELYPGYTSYRFTVDYDLTWETE